MIDEKIDGLLKSPNETDRKKAIAVLAKQPPSKEILLIIRDLAEYDESLEVRFFAKKALAYIKETIKPKISEEQISKININNISKFFSSDKTPEEKLAVIQYAINKNLTVLIDTFILQLSLEEDSDVIAALLIAIGKLSDESKIKFIIPYLNHENPRIRANAIEALEFIGSTKVYPYIILKINDPDNRVRSNAAKALKKIDPALALRILKNMLTSQSYAMQASAAYVMQFIIDESNIEYLMPLLNSNDESVRKNALAAINKYKEHGILKAKQILDDFFAPKFDEKSEQQTEIKEQVVTKTIEEELIENLNNNDPLIRINAINQALQKGGLGIGKILDKQLDIEKDEKVLATIIINLGKLQHKESINKIIKYLKSTDNRCRANAVEAIKLMNDKQALQHLVPFLKDKNNRVKANAIVALAHEDYVDLFTPLLEMSESKDELMQKSAIYAIMEMGRRDFYGFLLILEKSKFAEVAKRAKECINKLKDMGIKVEKVVYKSGIEIKNDENTTAQTKTLKSKNTINFIDKNGQIKFENNFEDAKDFSMNLAMVKLNNKWGIIDSNGKMLVQCIYDDIQPFSNGLAATKTSGKWGFIDINGLMVIEPIFDEVGSFSEGLAYVRKDKLYGYIDKSGTLVIKPSFDYAENFKCGLAFIKTKGWFNKKISGFIDKTGNIIINTNKYDKVGQFYENLAFFSQNGKYGFIDKTGKIIIKPQFDQADSFFEGLAKVKLNNKYGFIDKTGKLVIECKYDDALKFSDSLAAVCLNSKWGYIDKEGKIFIKHKYDNAKNFLDSLAPVKLGNKWGVINKLEKIIVNFEFDDISEFYDGFAKVYKKNN